MKAKGLFLKYHAIFYGFICLLANALAVLSSGLTSFPLPDREPLRLWQDFLNEHSLSINILGGICYLVPVACCVLYALPLRSCRPSDPAYMKVAVNLPGAFALRGILGWVCNFFLMTCFLFFFRRSYQVDVSFIFFSSVTSYVFISMLAFTLTYFTLETLNRNLVRSTSTWRFPTTTISCSAPSCW